jgi:hypothetical protein
LKGNVGLIFTKADLKEVREEVAKYKVSYLFYSTTSLMLDSCQLVWFQRASSVVNCYGNDYWGCMDVVAVLCKTKHDTWVHEIDDTSCCDYILGRRFQIYIICGRKIALYMN